jgi:hypothetical protein
VSASLERSFFIQRQGRTHGPCSFDELTNYLCYGSLKPEDLVWDQQADQWLPLQEVVNPAPQEAEEQEELTGWRQIAANFWRSVLRWMEKSDTSAQPRRRAVRFRDFFRVPDDQKAGPVLKNLALGTLVFPLYTLRLWGAAATLFSKRVFRDKKNEEGFLIELPRAFEGVAAVLIVINALAWMISIHWCSTVAWPVAVQLGDAVHGAFIEHFGSPS